jgi:hypothetical protein
LNVRPHSGIRLVALATPKSPEASHIGPAEQLDWFPGMLTVKPHLPAAARARRVFACAQEGRGWARLGQDQDAAAAADKPGQSHENAWKPLKQPPIRNG